MENPIEQMPRSELVDRIKTLRGMSQTKLLRYTPYPKQRQFHELGATHKERVLSAGNQQGKSHTGSFEIAMHATGVYPEWWTGKRFDRPTKSWCGGVTDLTTRDIIQEKLMGPKPYGMGAIPKDRIIATTPSRSVSELLDYVKIKHQTGGTSTIHFKSYAQGEDKWQAVGVDVIWLDEEPPEPIYKEALARTIATKGILFMTFTPLKGMSEVVRLFYPKPTTQDRVWIRMEIEDALHIPASERARVIEMFKPHEREARIRGIPILGSGTVFDIPESIMIEEPIHPVPTMWTQILGIDFGWHHPTAGAWLAHDRDNDVVHLIHTYSQSEQFPLVHSHAFKVRGDWIPVAWPHDGMRHDKGSGTQIAQQYRDLGLNMLPIHAQFEDKTNGLEAGISEWHARMQTGRFKVARHLSNFWEEYHAYHRKDGIITEEHDDIMDATRYGLMMLRFAQTDLRIQFPTTAGMDYDPLDPSSDGGDDHLATLPEQHLLRG